MLFNQKRWSISAGDLFGKAASDIPYWSSNLFFRISTVFRIAFSSTLLSLFRFFCGEYLLICSLLIILWPSRAVIELNLPALLTSHCFLSRFLIQPEKKCISYIIMRRFWCNRNSIQSCALALLPMSNHFGQVTSEIWPRLIYTNLRNINFFQFAFRFYHEWKLMETQQLQHKNKSHNKTTAWIIIYRNWKQKTSQSKHKTCVIHTGALLFLPLSPVFM